MQHQDSIYNNQNGDSLHPNNYKNNHNMMHWSRTNWRDVVLPVVSLSHLYTQGMSYMIRGLEPDQHYEASVRAR